MMLPLYAALDRIDPRLVEAGAGPLRLAVDRASARSPGRCRCPGVVAGTLLTFIPAAGDYINAELLGTTKTLMIGNVIQDQFFAVRDYPTAAALSFILMWRSWCWCSSTSAGPGRRSWCDGHRHRTPRRGQGRRDRPSVRPARSAGCASASSRSSASLRLVYMFLPILVVIVFSFNDPAGRFNYQWEQFSTEAWTNLCGARRHVRRARAAASRSASSRRSCATDPRHADRLRARRATGSAAARRRTC